MLRVLEIEAYEATARHTHSWLADRIGIPESVVADCLEALSASGQIAWDGAHWRVASMLTVDTRPDAGHGARNKQFWAELGQQRIASDPDGLYSYNVFSVSETDLARLRRLHLAYFRQLRSIVSDSDPPQRVAVVNVQLFALDRPDRAT